MILLVIILILILILVAMLSTNYKENMINISKPNNEIKWKNSDNCSAGIMTILKKVFNVNNIHESKNKNWDLYIPCDYNNPNTEIEKININSEDQKLFLISNSEEIGGKNLLWKNLSKMYGPEAKELAPNTYLLYDLKDTKRLKNEYDLNKIYIMKKNIQRQEGLKISQNIEEILNGFNEGYVVAQELLNDPYLIDGRKINLRIYLLILCQNDNIDAYIHDNGFVYYTKEKYLPNNIAPERNITTGYIDREVYNKNPLTLEDFKKYLENKNENSREVFNNIEKMMQKIIKSVKNELCQNKKIKHLLTYQLFGCDIALDKNLKSKIIEINIGPSMQIFDQRDEQVKFQVNNDILKILKIIPNINNGYKKINLEGNY